MKLNLGQWLFVFSVTVSQFGLAFGDSNLLSGQCFISKHLSTHNPGPGNEIVIVTAPFQLLTDEDGSSFYRADLKSTEASAIVWTKYDKDELSQGDWTTFSYSMEIQANQEKLSAGGLFYFQGKAQFSSSRPYLVKENTKTGRTDRYFLSCELD